MNITRKIVSGVASVALLASLAVGPVLAADPPRTQTKFTFSGEAPVEVVPYVHGSKRLMFVDFSAKDFGNIQYIYFNLTYNADSLGNIGVKRGLEGSFLPTNEKTLEYSGVPYIRKQLNFGTCSRAVCTYDPNVRKVKLTVNVKMKSGSVDQYTTVLTVVD